MKNVRKRLTAKGLRNGRRAGIVGKGLKVKRSEEKSRRLNAETQSAESAGMNNSEVKS
jgi:hypothetical protein